MDYQIVTGSARFVFGMANVNDVNKWFTEHNDIIGLGFVGRSNVGKSSLINSIFGKSTARISKTPGRTRQINVFTFQLKAQERKDVLLPPLYLFDLPGYGYAKVSKEMSNQWDQMIDLFFQNLSKKVLIVNLQDARHPNQKVDVQFYNYLDLFDLDILLVLNKIDKLKKQKERSVLNNQKKRIYKEYKRVKQIHFVSAESKEGLDQLQLSLKSHLLDQV